MLAGGAVHRGGARGRRDAAADRQRAQRDLPVPARRGSRAAASRPACAGSCSPPPAGRSARRRWPSSRASRPTQACAHPRWRMGRKISVDSATMMNKGLEVIEAHWLFGVQCRARSRSSSIPRASCTRWSNTSTARCSRSSAIPDMRTPIAQALAWPERVAAGVSPLDLAQIGALNFAAPDAARFPCLDAGVRRRSRAGGSAPATLNAANEVAVGAFLERRIGFLDIAGVCAETLSRLPAAPSPRSTTRSRPTARRARSRASSLDRHAAHRMIDIAQKILAFVVTLGRADHVPRAGPLRRRAARGRQGAALLDRLRPRHLVAARRPRRDRMGALGSSARWLRQDGRRARGRRAPGGSARARSIGRTCGSACAIVAAGPLANLLLAVLLFAGTYLAGVPGQRASARGAAGGSPAAAAGLAERRRCARGRRRCACARGRTCAGDCCARRAPSACALRSSVPTARPRRALCRSASLPSADWEGNYLGALGLKIDLGVAAGARRSARQARGRPRDFAAATRSLAINGKPMRSPSDVAAITNAHPGERCASRSVAMAKSSRPS